MAMRAEAWLLGLLLATPLAWADARSEFLLDPAVGTAALAWQEVVAGPAEQLTLPYQVVVGLYPLDELEKERCEEVTPALEQALAGNPLALVGVLAMALCAEHVEDAVAARNWHARLAAVMHHLLRGELGRSPDSPLGLISLVDLQALELATGMSVGGHYWFWHKGDPLLRVGITDARGFEREWFVSFIQSSLPHNGLIWDKGEFHRTFLKSLRDDDNSDEQARVEGMQALQQWSMSAQRQRARELAANDPALGFAILLRCLRGTATEACVDADVDPLLKSEERDALVLRGLLLQRTLAGDARAPGILFRALQRRVGADAAIVQVWRDFVHIDRLDMLPEAVVASTRTRADAGAAGPAYLLARHPRSAADRERVSQRLQSAVDKGYALALLRKARRLASSDPQAAQALRQRAAEQGHHGARILALQHRLQPGDGTQAEQVGQLQALVRSSDRGAALWLARHYDLLDPAQPAFSYQWALQALQARSPSVLEPALQLLLKHRQAGKSGLATLDLDVQLYLLNPAPEQLQQWCREQEFAQACRQLFRRRATAGSVTAADMELLERAVRLGDREALRVTGEVLLGGLHGQPRDPVRGLGLIDRASGMGLLRAQGDAALHRCSSRDAKVYQPELGLRMIRYLVDTQGSALQLDILASCQAANGLFDEAVLSQQRALDAAAALHLPAEHLDAMRARLQQYRKRKAPRD